MGDFYELFFADAEAAAAALDIALTQRGEHDGRPIPMCGVPQHAAEAYLARLIRRGFRVAVAEQMEDPKSRPQGRNAKVPLRRDVVRLVTPGTITEEALLEAGRANLLLGTGAGPRRHRRGLAGRVHRPVRDRRAGAGRSGRPARPAGAGGDPVAAGAAARRMGRASARPMSHRHRLWWRGGGWRRRSASPAWTRSAASPTPRRSRRCWRWTMCAPPRPARCRASPARRRRAGPGCWRWMRRRAPAWRSIARATAARCIRCSARCSGR